MRAETEAWPAPAVPRTPALGAGALSPDEVVETADWIASLQMPDGLVPWFKGGHADPWNHVEAAMALACAGRWAEVERAFGWLAANQLGDGSWCTGYVRGGVVEPRRDPNVCSYVATGALWCSRLGAGTSFLEAIWPVVSRAMAWCLECQLPGGEIAWSVDVDGVRATYALLSANSSLLLSFHCAAEIASTLGEDPLPWSQAGSRVATAVAQFCRGEVTGEGTVGRRKGAFAPKGRWAMDWYYPVLTGALAGEEARQRIALRWGEFVEPGLGARCVADRYWVTAAETAECAMAVARAGLASEAHALLACTRHLRHPSGAYWTGCAHPECARYPGGQLSTYSAAAVVMADHVLAGRSQAAAIFAADGVAHRNGGLAS